ncbi:MAG: serine/threonine-protein kinase [Terriglobales bacterium]|jgi:serine/threonine protein kinase/tetratricopeptide (TPR) repeat protein
MPEKWDQVKELFALAQEQDPGNRSSFLRHACAGDDALRSEVESLLSSFDGADSFLEDGPIADLVSSRSHAMKGRRIGAYRIIREIGQGGMAVVYLGERDDQSYRKQVAIKMVKPGIDTEQVLDRFRNERQTLAALDHANIVKLLDGGSSKDGLPYLVMEYVEALPIDQYCDLHRLSIDDRLRLFREVCSAVQYAHEKLVIHRDLKPANILIAKDGAPRLLDFGIAKLLNPECFQTAPVTRTDWRPMTPEYASPEQIRGQAVTIATDVYSLGVLLFELLTGHRPYRYTGQSLLEMERLVYETDPEKASVVIDRTEEKVAREGGARTAITAESVSAQRGLHPAELRRRLRGDLDTMVMKALCKEPERRYVSVQEFSQDIERYLAGLPVRARKPTASYRASKVLRRHKESVAAVITVLALVAVVGTWGANRRLRHETKGLTGADTVVLADFTNRTGDAVFDDTLKTALSVSLRQSPFLNVLSDSRVAATLQQMTRPASTKLTPEVAHELCQRAESKAYVAGSIGSLGGEYVLELRAVNCQNGDTLAQGQLTATSKEKVLDALGRAASKLRGELGESLATVQKFDVPLAEATTFSLEALRAYSLGRKALQEKGVLAALPYDQRAIQLDPNFAMGYDAVGNDYNGLSQLGRASEYYTKAFQLREHASEREKLTIAADYYSNVTGELNKAAQTYLEEIGSYPRDGSAYGNLSLVYAAQGKYEKAAEYQSRDLRLVPDSVASYTNLANDSIALQRFGETRQIIHEAQAHKMDDPVFHYTLYALGFLGVDSAAMGEQQQWFAGTPGYENVGLALASDTEAYAGHLAKARELTKQAVDSAVRADGKENGAIWQAIAAQREAAFGNPAEARKLAVEALKLAPASQGAESEAALAFAMAGDAARAESLAENLRKRFPLDTQIQALWLPAIQAQLALNRKNPTPALDALQAASTIEFGSMPFINNGSCLYHAYVRGEAYLSAGQGSAAAVEFQKLLDHSGIVWNCWTGALAHLGAARANALEARTSQGADADAARVRALAAYKDFLALWKDADLDIPVLRQAQAEYAKLQ